MWKGIMTLIILFSEMLKLSKKILPNQKIFWRIIVNIQEYFICWNDFSKLINYLMDMCWNGQGSMVYIYIYISKWYWNWFKRQVNNKVIPKVTLNPWTLLWALFSSHPSTPLSTSKHCYPQSNEIFWNMGTKYWKYTLYI